MATRDRILDAAEKLLADKGLNAASLREITTAAGTNLASVNYHFRSKDELILAVFTRRIEPINRERMARLKELRDDAPLEAVLEALVAPMVELAPHKQLVARMFVERTDLLAQVFETQFRPVAAAFLPAFRARLPHLPDSIIAWRTNFVVGGLLHVFTNAQLIAKLGVRFPGFERTVAELVVFGANGLRAPLAEREAMRA